MKARVVALGAMALFVAACGDKGPTQPQPQPQPDRTPAAITALASDSLTGITGETIEVAVRVANKAGAALSGVTVQWLTQDGSMEPSSSTTDGSGVARAQWTLGTEPGTQRATARAGSVTTTLTASVSAGAVATITIEPDDATIQVGKTQQFRARLHDANGNPVEGSVTWSSSSPSIASIDGNGLATGKSVGIVTIRAQSEGKEGTARLEVKEDTQPPPAPAPTLEFSHDPSTIFRGESSRLEWKAENATSCTASGAWSGSKPTSGSQSVTPSQTSTYTLTCTGDGGSVSRSVTITVQREVAPPGERSYEDRPDETSGAMVHIFYIVAADGVDRQLDVNGTIENSIGSAQNWLARETDGRRLRFDTYGGFLDITFFRSQRTDAEIASRGSGAVSLLYREAEAAGLTRPGKKYLIYYDGGNDRVCGSAYLDGPAGAIYIRGLNGRCEERGWASSPSALADYLEYVALHEILHTLDIVSKEAPDNGGGSHVCHDSHDLMWGGCGSSWRFPAVLDRDRRNYYNESGLPSGIVNLAKSPYLRARSATAALRAQETYAEIEPFEVDMPPLSHDHVH